MCTPECFIVARLFLWQSVLLTGGFLSAARYRHCRSGFASVACSLPVTVELFIFALATASFYKLEVV